jgi:hypothetical protein
MDSVDLWLKMVESDETTMKETEADLESQPPVPFASRRPATAPVPQPSASGSTATAQESGSSTTSSPREDQEGSNFPLSTVTAPVPQLFESGSTANARESVSSTTSSPREDPEDQRGGKFLLSTATASVPQPFASGSKATAEESVSSTTSSPREDPATQEGSTFSLSTATPPVHQPFASGSTADAQESVSSTTSSRQEDPEDQTGSTFLLNTATAPVPQPFACGSTGTAQESVSSTTSSPREDPEDQKGRKFPLSTAIAPVPRPFVSESTANAPQESVSSTRRSRRQDREDQKGRTFPLSTTTAPVPQPFASGSTATAQESLSSTTSSPREDSKDQKGSKFPSSTATASVPQPFASGSTGTAQESVRSTTSRRRQHRQDREDQKGRKLPSSRATASVTQSSTIGNTATAQESASSTTSRRRQERQIRQDQKGSILPLSTATSPVPQPFAIGIIATTQESVSSTTSSRREDQKTSKFLLSEESEDEERPGAISVKGRFDDVTVQDDILKESPDADMDEENLPIVAELVEDDDDRVSEMVAELMRQEKLRQMSSPSAHAYDGDPISHQNGSTTVQAAVVIETKRICGVPRIWFLVGVVMLILLLGLVSIAVVVSGSKDNGASEMTTSNPTLAPTTPAFLLQQDIQSESNRDFFGHYVEFSRDESTVAVGAPGYFPSVQVFRKTAGSSDWEKIGQTIEGNGDAFGYRLDLNEDGNILVIGAPKNNEMGENAGLVRVYKYMTSDSWVQIGQDVKGLEAAVEFGWDVAISDDGRTFVASARVGNPDGLKGAGYVQVYTFDFTEDQWIQLGQLLAGEAAADVFGRSVAMSSSGGRVAIGSTFGGGGKGRIYVYDYSDENDVWEELGKVIDGLEDQDWQDTVDLSADGNILAIGTDGHDTNGSNSGMARVYRLEGCCVWAQQGDTIYGEEAGDTLGSGQVSLSNDGGMLAVGSPNFNGRTGKAHLYRWISITKQWELVGRIEGGDELDDLGFSINVSGNGSYFAVGVPRIKNDELPGHVEIYSVE